MLIARRHDNINDARTYQPVVKTIARRIPLADTLIKAVSDYVLGERRRFSSAKRHDYLFIVHQTGPFSGEPLSLKGLAKVFQQIQTTESHLLKHLTPQAIERIARLERENERLKRENAELLQQYVVWQYNAHIHDLSNYDLNKNLPGIDRGQTD